MVPQRIKVIDSTSFAIGTQTYRLAGMRPVVPKRMCQAIEGGRWSCGRMASIFLGNLVRSKRMLCDVGPAGATVLLSRCVIGSHDVSLAIIANGYGMAEADKGLLAAQVEAQKAARLGLWRNPLCTTDFDHC
jgi:endonuclease YncB( thermonuclease family)